MPNYNLIVLCIIVGVFIAIVTSLAVAVMVSNNKYRKNLEKLSYYQINTAAKIDQSIPELLELIISESFRDYQVIHLVHLNEGYINNEREAQIRKELVNLVTNRISNATLDKLSLFYNLENIANILADKIYIIVMDYVVKHNSGIPEQ